jgi:SAM-dependent methyltransferase
MNVCSIRKNLQGDREVEWSWTAAWLPAGPGRALDFGPGASHLALQAALKGFEVLSIDLTEVQRPYLHPSITFQQGDLLALDLAPASFDLVINCSTVEHVGLAGRYNVTEDLPDGDLQAMKKLLGLMKPGGTMVMTVPVGLDKVYPPLHRVYGEERLPRLIEGFTIEREAYWIKDEANCWTPVPRAEALAFPTDAGSMNALENVYGLGGFVLKRP